MKFQLLLFVFALNLGGGLVRAQVECVFLPTEQEDKSPELLEKHLEFEKLWQLGANDESQRRAVEFIPVVIHIIHDQGIGDISDAQVLKAMDFLIKENIIIKQELLWRSNFVLQSKILKDNLLQG